MGFNNEKEKIDGVVRSFDEEKKKDQEEEGRGFSLIELMVVIAIIGILAGVAFLSILHYRMTIRVNASARDLAGHMRVARANAIRHGYSQMFRFINSPSLGYGFEYGQDADHNNVFDGGSRTYWLEAGIVFGYLAGTVPVPGHANVNSMGCSVFTTKYGTGPSCINDTVAPSNTISVHFNRSGAAMDVSSGSPHFTDGVAYMIPNMDMSGTGARDDRQRAIGWHGASGRVRLWYYKASKHFWR